MDNLIKWYLKTDSFSMEEEKFMQTEKVKEPTFVTEEEFKKLTQKFFDRMPYCNISSEDRYITFDESGSDIIRKIFEKEVDDETLVISTTYEHGTVQEELNDVKNKLLLNSDRDIRGYQIENIIKESKKYKKVFVYIIGTQLSTGEITPQLFFEELDNNLSKNNIPHKIMIDDVHGMFLVPRDYRMFDYILYTAHSLVTEYDMGFLISKDGTIGIKAYNWGRDYIERLDIMLNKKEKMLQFRNILIQYFSKMISDITTFKLFNQTSNHIFAIETKGITYTKEEWEKLDNYKIRVNETPMEIGWIRIRFQEFTRQTPEVAIEGLHYLFKLLNRAIMKKKMREGL